MLITLHSLAHTYKMLPSECLDRASTFDLYVMDTFHRYQIYQEKKAQGGAPPAPKMTQEQMKAMLAKARSKETQERFNAKNTKSL
jgi:hypothetical protein